MYGDTTLFIHSAMGRYWDVSGLKGLGNIFFLKGDMGSYYIFNSNENSRIFT